VIKGIAANRKRIAEISLRSYLYDLDVAFMKASCMALRQELEKEKIV